jgi:hypothetical protein
LYVNHTLPSKNEVHKFCRKVLRGKNWRRL